MGSGGALAARAAAPESFAGDGGTTRPVGYSPFMRRIERLINLIAALLEARRPMTADEIREQIAGYDQPNFEAFRRAFERDKEALRAMGIPLEVRSTDPFVDQADGYIIPKEKYYLPDLDLEPDELTALQIAAQAVLGAQEQAGSGLLKLSVADGGGGIGPGRISWGADLAAEQPALGPLYSALLERTPVRFDYETADGTVSARLVEPYGLVHRRGNWYLVACDVDRGEQRTFRVSRIASQVQVVEGRYEIPDSFDAEAYVAREAWETGAEEVTAVVRFDPSIRWWVEQNLRGHPQVESDDGAVEVRVDVANADAFVSWIIELGEGIEIVSPDALRSRLCQRIQGFMSQATAGPPR
ncbi:MAG: WYL domain-containing protein [Actinomycetota bacterium]|nr:WYL domain-containing protein [Actinomycetota bacterium]